MELPSIEKLAEDFFNIAKDRFSKADVWEGKKDVESLREFTDICAHKTMAILMASTDAERKHHQETIDMMFESLDFEITKKGIKLNKFGKDLFSEFMKVASQTVITILKGMI